MNKSILVLPLLAFSLGACATRQADTETLKRAIGQRGTVIYDTPRGNPLVLDEWSLYGPGAVRHRGAATVTANAKRMIGDQLVADHASLKTKSPVEALNRSEVKEQDIKLLGEGPVEVVARVKAQVAAARSTRVSVVMGKVWEVPMTEIDLIEACKKNAANHRLTRPMISDLRSGRRDLLLTAIYAEGMTFKFTREQAAGASVEAGVAALPQAGTISVGGNTYHWTSSGLEMNEPRFLGYRVLRRDEVREIFPR